MLSTLRSTENWSHFFFSWRGNKPEDFKHAHDSCIYCTEWVVELHDDLCLLAQHPLFLSFWKGNSAAMKPLLNSRCKKPKRTKKDDTNTQMPEHKLLFLFLDTKDSFLHTAEFSFSNRAALHPGCWWWGSVLSPFRGCTNRLVPQTWLLLAAHSGRPPVSLKHLFSQWWQMNMMFFFVVHFNLCFDDCYSILNGEAVQDVCIQRKAEYVIFCQT